MQKNIKNAGLIEIDKSGAVMCFASKTAIKGFKINLNVEVE